MRRTSISAIMLRCKHKHILLSFVLIQSSYDATSAVNATMIVLSINCLNGQFFYINSLLGQVPFRTFTHCQFHAYVLPHFVCPRKHYHFVSSHLSFLIPFKTQSIRLLLKRSPPTRRTKRWVAIWAIWDQFLI